MRFSLTESRFVEAHPRLRSCVLPYESLKGDIKSDRFFGELERAVKRADRSWTRRARVLIGAYRVVGDVSMLTKSCADLLEAASLTKTGIRKICKKRDKLVPGSGGREWHEAAVARLKSSGALATDLAAVLSDDGSDDGADNECPICLSRVMKATSFSCGHAMCAPCCKTLKQCPVCRRPGHKRALLAWRSRDWMPAVPGGTAMIMSAYVS